MKKIPTIFKRNPDDMKVLLNERNPMCQWVFDGEGIATRKYDGTCCLIQRGVLYKRREVKKGKEDPEGFFLADCDEVTGKRVGWLPVDENDKWHLAALENCNHSLRDGTYELVGPKIQGNPECFLLHTLLAHDEAFKYDDAPLDYYGIQEWLKGRNIEGIVFHHRDGRMAKIKKRDFGLKRWNHDT